MKLKVLSMVLFLLLVSSTAFALNGSFKDVDSKSWYASSIDFVNSNSIMTGYEDNTFKPDQNVTRAELAQTLTNLMSREQFKKDPVNTQDQNYEQKVIQSVINNISSVVKIQNNKGIGSGFFIAENLILTNYHVVGEDPYVWVLMYDGKLLYSEVVKRNKNADSAIIKTSHPQQVKPVKFNTKIVLGETIIAIGNPFGYKETSFSVTKGIISNFYNSYGQGPDLPKLRVMQIDAAINGGNSGGPVINLNGEVVGMVTSVLPDSERINFAIPADDILTFINEK